MYLRIKFNLPVRIGSLSLMLLTVMVRVAVSVKEPSVAIISKIKFGRVSKSKLFAAVITPVPESIVTNSKGLSVIPVGIARE